MNTKKPDLHILSDGRYLLVPLCGGMIRAKLNSEEFSYLISYNYEAAEALFPAAWPADLAAVFESWSYRCKDDKDIITGTFVIVDKVKLMAVGAIGTKSDPYQIGRAHV